MVRLSEDRLDVLITFLLLVSIGFLAINYNIAIASTLIILVLLSIFVFFALPSRITHNSKPNNTFNAILWGAGGVVGILFISLFVTTAFQGLLNVTAEPSFNSIINDGFSSLGTTSEKVIASANQPVFAQSALLMLFTFGIVIAVVETRALGRAMELVAKFANVNLDKFWNVKVIALFTILSVVFVWYHATAKDITRNVPLLITFIFSFVSLEFIRRHKEMESATYLHVFNNFLYLIPNIEGI